MVRLLFNNKLIEKFGDKPYAAPKALKNKIKEKATQNHAGQGMGRAAGTKRKAPSGGTARVPWSPGPSTKLEKKQQQLWKTANN